MPRSVKGRLHTARPRTACDDSAAPTAEDAYAVLAAEAEEDDEQPD